MPIRINLLAEKQAAEELRRRDPVKRALWVACGLIGLALLYIAYVQVKIFSTKASLRGEQARYEQLLPKLGPATNIINKYNGWQWRLTSLERYASNRFLWTRPLNALQFLAMHDVRVVSVRGEQQFNKTEQVTVAKDSMASREWHWYKFWVKPPKTNMVLGASNVLYSITNQGDFARYHKFLKCETNVDVTKIQIIGKAQATRPAMVTEKITMVIKGRDYTPSTKRSYQAFYAGLTNSSYFQAYLGQTNSWVDTGGSLQTKTDEQDEVDRARPYIEFTIEGTFPERVHVNE